ncbi:hypothetical protein ACFX2I_032709 [Malus domestica]
MEETSQAIARVIALIINTFDDLETSTHFHIAIRFPQVYTNRPLHALFKSRVGSDLSSLAASFGRQFLWAVRLDKLRGEQGELVIPVKLEVGTKERVYSGMGSTRRGPSPQSRGRVFDPQ